MKVRRFLSELRRKWRRGQRLVFASVGTVVLLVPPVASAAAPDAAPIDGEELFLREWIPDDTRAHGGDGLGPVFNESSCVSCHNQGGTGGAGTASKNVDIISAFQNPVHHGQRPPNLPDLIFRGMFGGFEARPADKRAKTEEKNMVETSRAELIRIHPGFETAGSVVLHRFSTDPSYESWRQRMKGSNDLVVVSGHFSIGSAEGGGDTVRGAANRARAMQELQMTKQSVQRRQFGILGTHQVGNFILLASQRNPTSLFGVGQLDAVSDDDLRDAASVQHKEFPEISGRVAKLKDGRIGRFGWKAQTATLEDFTLTACAVELGLHVPGHDQAGMAQKPDYQAPGFDLTAEECKALENYLRDLPRPEQRDPRTRNEARYLKGGETHFAKIGCAACHTPKIGQVAGVYSDLLLHDMGDDLGDTGQYGVFVPNTSEDQIQGVEIETFASARREPTAEELEKTVGALRTEWRTPPLWGVRDSAPYLHDGRAETLEEAIAMHGGEGEESARKYFELTPKQRLQLQAFLRSLTAPTELARAH